MPFLWNKFTSESQDTGALSKYKAILTLVAMQALTVPFIAVKAPDM
jgi:hypothetical protein